MVARFGKLGLIIAAKFARSGYEGFGYDKSYFATNRPCIFSPIFINFLLSLVRLPGCDYLDSRNL
jgi:hypothetical protein